MQASSGRPVGQTGGNPNLQILCPDPYQLYGQQGRVSSGPFTAPTRGNRSGHQQPLSRSSSFRTAHPTPVSDAYSSHLAFSQDPSTTASLRSEELYGFSPSRGGMPANAAWNPHQQLPPGLGLGKQLQPKRVAEPLDGYIYQVTKLR